MVQEIVHEPLEKYAEQHSAPAPPLLNELAAAAGEKYGPLARMISGRTEGLLLQSLLVALRAKHVLEIGTFVGYSALTMAEALPRDGELITLEIEPSNAAFARSYMDRSEHGRKIRIIEGPALDSIRMLTGTFDLVFIDADKGNYTNYYEATLPLLAEPGLIVVDNVLWSGRVLDPQSDDDKAIVAFNEHVAHDPRVTVVMLTIRDGVSIIRRR
jgi:caffeoyl-CoA O-methyltransferase